MRKMVDFMIRNESTFRILETVTKELLKEGWEPIGDVHVVDARVGGPFCYMTMGKFEVIDD